MDNTSTSTTVPFTPCGNLNEVSLTSLAFSPKIALKSFSSAGGSLSPLGVTLPTRISSGVTCAPILIIPFSSRFLSASSETLGISLVISSSPSFVVLASISNSSICKDVNTSSFLSLSDIRIPSSKLYPSQGMNASRIFFPSARSPPAVEGPSAIISPFLTFSSKSTIGF